MKVDESRIIYDAFMFGVFVTLTSMIGADFVGFDPVAIGGLLLFSLTIADVVMYLRQK